VRGVADEGPLSRHRPLHPVKHRVERVRELGQLVPRTRQRDARVEAAALGDRVRGGRDRPDRRQCAARHEPAGDEPGGAEDGQCRQARLQQGEEGSFAQVGPNPVRGSDDGPFVQRGWQLASVQPLEHRLRLDHVTQEQEHEPEQEAARDENHGAEQEGQPDADRQLAWQPCSPGHSSTARRRHRIW